MRVALMAMSGVRAYNQELVALGMTLPGFVERSQVIASMPSLSLLTLAGMTPDRFDVEYVEVVDYRALETLPACDVAAISTYTAQAHDAYALSERFRAEGVPTIIGGLHATVLPDEAAEYCTSVVVGEGELSWPRILEDLEAGKLQPLYSAEGQEFDLADAPVPRFDLLDIDQYNRLPVQTQRGCPWHCDFCASSILLTPRYKVKPVEKVIGEIREIKRLWNRPFIEFADDNTFVNKRHGKELMRELAKEDVRWFTESDIAVADDEELLTLMHEAGCAQVLVGLESPTADSLEGLELKRNWKHSRFPTYVEAVRRIQEHGITVNGCYVLGLDGQGPEVFDAIAEFVEQTGQYEVQITIYTPFPGTPLYDRLLKAGRILEPAKWEKCSLFDVNFVPDSMSVAELEQGLIDLGQRVYNKEARRKRVHGFRHQVEQSPYVHPELARDPSGA